MRPLVVALFGGLIAGQMLPAIRVRGEDHVPFKAIVISDNTYARSGPGQDYYPTDPLRHGQEIEVYRQNPDGWCAIRPVDGSFTWVPGRYVRPTGNNLAVVTDEGVAARVGSRVNNSRDMIQVRLHQGEVVEILESPRSGDWDEGGGWYKIAPPSGEFRWVAAQDLVASPGNAIADKTGSTDRGRELSPDEAVRARLTDARSYSPESFRAEIERSELDLSIIVAEDPAKWSFDALSPRTEVLFNAAQTPSERGRVRLLAERIAQFEEIQKKETEMLAQRERTERSGRLLARMYPGGESAEPSPPRFDNDGRFDGTGILVQVAASKPGSPRYALANDNGVVLCYVTAAPGVNLYGYLGRRVGLVGNRGYMPERQATHIMAKHITPLEGRNMLR
jgi:hypothetical protein